jgi:hypothetical protein
MSTSITRKGWGVVALLALLVCVGVAQTSVGHTLLQHAGLFEVQPPLTELAFSDPQALPSKLTSEHPSINVSFRIQNVSLSPRTYQWSIVLVRSGRSYLAASDAQSVPPNGDATVNKTVVTTCAGGRLQVRAQLAAPAEAIDFWVACPADQGGAS